MNQDYYKLFACCVPVRGYLRSAVCDLQRKDYWLIPNDLCDILLKDKDESVNNLIEKHKGIDVKGYFEYLFENEICFPCDQEDLELFPELDKQWHIPFEFETCIVDFAADLIKELPKIVDEISDFAIPNVQLRFYSEISQKELKQVINAFFNSKIKFIELIVPNIFCEEFIDDLVLETSKIRLIVLTSSQNRGRRDVEQATVYHTEQVVDTHNHCGIIQEEQFVCEMRTFCESTKFNSCLNCKVSIDVDGNIRNCPSMKESFGNIRNTTIDEALSHPDFKKYWSISKDTIEVCKDCEYRHMCTDCRAYLKQPGNIYSQPAKCFYNPYIAKWKGDDGYIPVEEYGLYNEEGKFVLDKLKVDSLNLELWGA
ncbi:grasp-with-spasm system SPASM domain peptide maturase [Ancylomarina longa]|uniref:Grasp-with-spasm system SPASM domain peptide maturase n=1 Tax=Ancylomarina longa TaxID=2487017 RepID=A0A434AWG4_9BACT|nr:grasp-with-spasm system SPASM domain peptide maturase [Ancylomarina longa]RUT78845.1 grasp-with-spasm system SPASM domain peptide maturase [Ancylomarina longa]